MPLHAFCAVDKTSCMLPRMLSVSCIVRMQDLVNWKLSVGWLERNALAPVSLHVHAHANRSCLPTGDACTHLRCNSQPRVIRPAFSKYHRKFSEIELHVDLGVCCISP